MLGMHLSLAMAGEVPQALYDKAAQQGSVRVIVQLRVTTIPEGTLESTDAEQWRGVRMTPKILRTLDALRVEGIPQAEQAAA